MGDILPIFRSSDYPSVTDYLLCQLGPDDYQKQSGNIEKVLEQVDQFNQNYPKPKKGPLTDSVYCTEILKVVDFTFTLFGWSIFNNMADQKIECAAEFFPKFNSNEFAIWLINHIQTENDKHSIMD